MDHILDRTLGTIGNIRDSNYLKSTLNYLVYGTLRNSRELNEIGRWGFLFSRRITILTHTFALSLDKKPDIETELSIFHSNQPSISAVSIVWMHY